MKQEFCSYEQSIALKELGFDEPCFGFYDESLYFPNNENQYGTFCKQPKDVPACSAPLKQQVFRWFREKYNLRGFIGFRPNVKKFDYHIYDMSLSGIEYVKQRTMEEYNKDPLVGTYEEAESACIDKLIEIVKINK